jgi:hypothetical protein
MPACPFGHLRAVQNFRPDRGNIAEPGTVQLAVRDRENAQDGETIMDPLHWLEEALGFGDHHEASAGDHFAVPVPGAGHLAGTAPGELGASNYEALAGVQPPAAHDSPVLPGSEVLDRVNAQLTQAGAGEPQPAGELTGDTGFLTQLNAEMGQAYSHFQAGMAAAAQAPHLAPGSVPASGTADPYHSMDTMLQGQIYQGQVDNSVNQWEQEVSEDDAVGETVQGADQAIIESQATVADADSDY